MAERAEYVSCNLCGNDDTTVYLKLDGFSYQRCRRCGLVYQNPRPVFGDLEKRYGANYFDYEYGNQENFFKLMQLGLRDIGFDSLFQTRPPRGTFLDIGCATGLLLNEMKGKGWDCRGVEICRESAEYAMRQFGLDIFIGTLEEAAFPESTFNAVHLSHLIEHVPNPRALLLEIRRILKPYGYMILTTPNAGGLQARCSRATWRSAIADHVYLFSKRTMGQMLRTTGFTVLKQISWGGIPAGKRPGYVKRPADRLAKLFNLGDVMLFHCSPSTSQEGGIP
jgi:2-polyprenyl-3-methyl-5-hydroxy-6-metoxy-1,4-benzoquinol methylase